VSAAAAFGDGRKARAHLTARVPGSRSAARQQAARQLWIDAPAVQRTGADRAPPSDPAEAHAEHDTTTTSARLAAGTARIARRGFLDVCCAENLKNFEQASSAHARVDSARDLTC
jgi:hypothetical protein